MKKLASLGIILIISMILVFSASLQAFAAKTITLLDGKVSITDDLGNGSGSGTEYTVTVTSGLLSAKSCTITITNETGKRGTISFGYEASNASSLTIDTDGNSGKMSGSYSANVDPERTIQIGLSAAKGYKKATLNLTNIKFQAVSESAKITYEFNSELGTITADGTAVNSGDTIEISKDSPVEMSAAPLSDAVFVGWVDAETNEKISLSSTYTQESVSDKTIKALFIEKDTPWFLVNDIYIFSDLNDAVNMDDADDKADVIVLMCDGVLPAGNYTIGAEKILLIPFNDANTLCTDKPEVEQVGYSSKKAYKYRTLTLASGANIFVDGAISLSGTQSAQINSNGSPIGAYGHIAMESGSTITVNSGANLYTWGYITGSGTITAESGATVYECFQVRDWRGGDATSSMINNGYRVFPMSQYYVQNIEVPLTLKAGAVENGYMSTYVTLVGIQSAHVPFIGTTDALFIINDGYVIKDYQESADRLIIDVYGKVNMDVISITMKLGILGFSTMDSSKYTLPVNGNITLNINSGSVNVNSDMALLPGGEIKVLEGAECVFSPGVKAFIYDKDQWGGYCSQKNLTFMAAHYAPGRTHTRTDDDLKDAKVCIAGTVDASGAYVYTTGEAGFDYTNGKSGADIQGSQDGTGGTVKISTDGPDEYTYQVVQDNTSVKDGYKAIPVTTAWLKNADGTFTDPEVVAGCLSSYIYSNGKWFANHEFSKDFICSSCGCKKIATNTSYSIADDNITINTSLILEIPNDAQIIIATYDSEGRLLDASLKTALTLEEVVFSSKGVEEIKVFVWDGLDTMKPLSFTEEIAVTVSE